MADGAPVAGTAGVGLSASELKAQGNTALQNNDLAKAVELYKKGLQSKSITKEDELALHLNLGLCYSKQNKHEKTVDECSIVLKKDPMNPKALFRRSKAYCAMEKLQEAALDAKALQRYHPTSTAATDLIKELTFLAKNSEAGARKALTDACKQGADPILMKQILGVVAEDEGRARECVTHDGVELLLSHATENPLSYNVIGRLIGYDSTFARTLESVKKFFGGEGQWVEGLIKVLKDAETADIHAAAVLMILKAAATKKHISITNTIFVDSLKDSRTQVREVAIDACCALYSSDRDASEVFVKDLNGIESLSEVCKEEPQLGSLCLSRIVPVLIRVDKTKDDLVADRCAKLCAPAFNKSEDLASVDSISRVKAGLNALLAVFNASHDVGLEVVGPNAERLAEMATSAPDKIVAVVSEILAQTGNSEKGRAVLGTMSNQLHVLIGHSDPAIRAAASVALTKIEAVHFDTNTDSGALVLGSVGHLFREGATPEEIARGIEAVSFVVADTDVKMMLTTGNEGTRLLKSLVARARELKEAKDTNSSIVVEEGKKAASKDKTESTKQLSAETVYGIAYLLQNLTMDEDDKKREKLREMEVSQEQWEQFEKITKQKSRSGNSRKDSPEEVAQRIDAVVNAGGAMALKHIIQNRPTPVVAGAVAKAMQNMASQARVRGTMISQGAVSCLAKAHKIGSEEEALKKTSDTYRGSPICRDAAHGLARLLITTDPRLLTNAQVMDSLTPLVEQVRRSDEDLVVFECLMALTNLAVVSDQVKDKIISLKGLPVFEYAQFSDTPLVRRAATEAIANLFPSDGLITWLQSGDKIRLFILFGEDFDSDMQTSRAALGLLAQAAWDEKVASRMRRFGAVDRLTEILLTANCPFGECAWRIAVTLNALSEVDFVDTSDETKNEQTKVSSDGTWIAENGPWTDREQNAVTACFKYILSYKPDTPAEQQFWANAVSVAKEALAKTSKLMANKTKN